MSWSFPNADTYAVTGVGSLPQNGAAISVWWMVRPSVATDFGTYVGLESGSNRIGLLAVVSKYFTANDGTGGPAPVNGEWQIIGYDDNNAGGGTVRWHHGTNLTGTPSWAHSNGPSGGDRSGVVDTLRLGIGPDGFRMRGHIAAGAIANSRLGDAGFEALSTTLMSDWVSKAVVAWQFNVAVGSTALLDLVGDADQTSLTGTPTLDTGTEPPNWTYYSPGATVTGTAAADLGALTATAVGTRTVFGTAVADLGALAATITTAPHGQGRPLLSATTSMPLVSATGGAR